MIVINKVTPEQVQEVIDKAEITFQTLYDKNTLCICHLENGFLWTETSGSVSKETYDFEIGKKECMKKIRDKVWRYLGFTLSQNILENNK